MSTKRGRWLGVYSWLLLAYLLVPIVGMVFFSFNDVLAGRPTVTFEWNGATLRWYRELTNSGAWELGSEPGRYEK